MIDKLQQHVRNYGSKTQQRKALELLLPTSFVYDFLEGRLPHPSDTYTKIAQILEIEEKERISLEIARRRTRLGARIEQVRRDVRLEVLSSSTLENLYQQIINWTRDDELRRQYEERLLEYAYETLTVLPIDKKDNKRREVEELARGTVIIKHPFKLAWTIVLEWNDKESLASLDVQVLREYVEFFSEDGLAKVLQGYLTSEISPFGPVSDNGSGAKTETHIKNGDMSQEEPMATLEGRLLRMTV